MLEGLPPNNAAHVMRLRCAEAQARQIADIIVETFEPAEAAASAFEENINTRDWSGSPWIVEAYFAHKPDEATLRGLPLLLDDTSAFLRAVRGLVKTVAIR